MRRTLMWWMGMLVRCMVTALEEKRCFCVEEGWMQDGFSFCHENINLRQTRTIISRTQDEEQISKGSQSQLQAMCLYHLGVHMTEWSTNCTAIQTIITHNTLGIEILAMGSLLSSASRWPHFCSGSRGALLWLRDQHSLLVESLTQRKVMMHDIFQTGV